MIKVKLLVDNDWDGWDNDVSVECELQVIPPIGAYISIDSDIIEVLEKKAISSFKVARKYHSYLYGHNRGKEITEDNYKEICFDDLSIIKDIIYTVGDSPILIQLGT